MTVVTRFAPSPTGFLHIGGARTALFNWLFAKHNSGKFLLRIEDTDRERSTDAATAAILDGLKWLGLDWDDKEIHQFARKDRHAEVAKQMLAEGKAFHCYSTPKELEEFRAKNPNAKFRSPWRDGGTPPEGVAPAIRLKAPLEGETVIDDKVQGSVVVKNSELDDMILLRSDGTPVYMLAVVVDDHDMGITQIIRGDDHFTNSFRQRLIYDAMGWDVPQFAHIPLIHGADGAKLSKRHGALGVDAYRDMGYLPEAVRNYLLRLGWAHGNDEIISTEQAIEWFGLEGLGKSPSRFDFTKLENLNGHYIREASDARLMEVVAPLLEKKTGKPLSASGKERLQKGMHGLKQRAKTMIELADNALFYVVDEVNSILAGNAKAQTMLAQGGKEMVAALLPELEGQAEWKADSLQAFCKTWAEKNGKKLGDLAQPLRVALTGSTISPSTFEVMEVLGKDMSIQRLKQIT
jgi:glutamyl-tRNA synthetase